MLGALSGFFIERIREAVLTAVDEAMSARAQ
jgi:hypothetical protein